MQWPSNVEDSSFGREAEDRRYSESYSRKKEKFSRRKERESLEQDEYTEPSDSSSESDSDEHAQHKKKDSSVEQLHRKKHGKKSSRKVVIRNINYITSNRDGEKDGISQGNSSDEDDFINEASLKQHVEEASGSLERQQKRSSHHHKKRNGTKHPHNIDGSTAVVDSEGEKRNDSWDAFQNLLLRDREVSSKGLEPHPIQGQEEYSRTSFSFNLEREEVTKQRVVSSDSFVVTGRDTGNEGKTYIKNFEAGENAHLIKKRDSTYEELLFSEGMDGSGNSSRANLSDFATESSMIRSRKGGDWFIDNQPDTTANRDKSIGVKMFDGDSFHTEKNKKDILVDDSFMIQPQSIVNDQSNSHFGTDISMVADIAGATQHQNDASEISQDKLEAFSAHEPDDLYMVLDRDSAAEHVITSWTPEMDYVNNISSTEADRGPSDIETTGCIDDKLASNGKSTGSKNSGAPKEKASSKEARPKALGGSLVKSRSEIISRSKKPSPGSRNTIQKSKSEKEEDSRKKMEELMLQRQKRIAERSAANGFTPTSKKTPFSTKNEKLKTQSSTQESEKLHKPVLRSSTIDRLAAARTNQKAPSTQLRPGQPKKAAVKANGAIATTLSQKAVGPENKKPGMNKVKSTNKKNDPKDLNGKLSTALDVPRKEDCKETSSTLPIRLTAAQATQPEPVDDYEDIKELHTTSSIEKNEGKVTSQGNTLDDKKCNGSSLNGDSSVPTEDHSARLDYLKGNINRASEASLVLPEDKTVSDIHVQVVPEITAHPLPASANKSSNTALNIEDRSAANKNFHVSTEISEIEISTPPPSNVLSPEPVHSRKKWDNVEDSPKATKGFRKLLLFGRKR